MELENKPKDTDLAQQRIQPLKIMLGSMAKAILYLVFGLVFMLFGVLIVVAANKVIEHKKRYDDKGECDTVGGKCSFKFDINEHMKGDVFLYYEIKNLYQNHRQYSRGLSVGQMLGHNMQKSEVERVCDPIIEFDDLHERNRETKKDFEKDSVANPCGVIANSFFNDTFSLEKLHIKEHDIAFSRDKDDKFKKTDSVKDKRWTDVTNEHFIVWTSIAPTPTFRKLWGRIDGIDKGNYRMNVSSRFKVGKFDGKKSVILTTKTVIGGKNYVIGVIYILVGAISFFSSFVFWYEFYLEKNSLNK